MRDFTDRALNVAALAGASYADVRIERLERQVISVKNGRPDGVVEDEGQGFGIRVIVDGAWGFASSSRLDTTEVERVARQAVGIARATARVLSEPVHLGEPITAVASYATPVKIDPGRHQVSL